MASSSSIKLLSPLRLWLIFNGLFIALVASSWYSSYRLAAAENKKLAANQVFTLTKSGLDDLNNRRFRDFVEGIGREFGNLYIQVSIGEDVFRFGQISKRHHCGNLIYPLENAEKASEASITVCRSFEFAASPMLMVLSVYLLISLISLYVVHRLERRTTSTLVEFLKDSGVSVNANHGLIGVLNEIRTIGTQLEQAKMQERLFINAKAQAELAAQVAHDIRSPLAALDAVITSVNQVPEKKRLIIRNAVNRIKDIANHLLEINRRSLNTRFIKQQEQNGGFDKIAEDSSQAYQESLGSAFLLSSLIEPLITEKRLQFCSKGNINITADLDDNSYGLFAKVEPRECKRILSNLINNSVEASGEKGEIKITLSAQNEQIVLKVQDNGKGIPPDILPKLGQRGKTYGKTGGSGLGLYHARTTLESWSGSLSIESEVGKKTIVTLKLPAATPPSWFISKLTIPFETTVIVLDDDPTIHQVWEERLNFLGSKEKGIAIIHCSTPNEFRQWVQTNPESSLKATCLTDYELLGFKETGLDVVERLNLTQRTILVTSRYEEKTILERCQRLGVRIIPKNLVGFVPISIGIIEEACDAVLIDDDNLTQEIWQMAAADNGKKLKVFSTPEELIAAADGLNKTTPIYLDSNLDNEMRGEKLAKELHAQGFSDLVLCTGNLPESFPPMPWIKKIRSKEPPWA